MDVYGSFVTSLCFSEQGGFHDLILLAQPLAMWEPCSIESPKIQSRPGLAGSLRSLRWWFHDASGSGFQSVQCCKSFSNRTSDPTEIYLWNPLEDVAVVFLGGRKFVLQDSDAFINGMKSRLVVMLNSEDAATTFRQVEHNITEQIQTKGVGNDVQFIQLTCGVSQYFIVFQSPGSIP